MAKHIYRFVSITYFSCYSFAKSLNFQKTKYWTGVGADANPVERLFAGLLGEGCHSLIKEVYRVRDPV